MTMRRKNTLLAIAVLVTAGWSARCCPETTVTTAECTARRVPNTDRQVVECDVAGGGSANDTIPVPQ
jgi:hypothetical protein